MYSGEQYYNALALYDKCGSVTKVITQLGYPVRRQTLYNWIARRKHIPSSHSTFRGINTAEHPRHPALELKLDTIHRCFELGESVQSVTDEIGYSKASIYQWRRKYIQKGRAALMEPPNERSYYSTLRRRKAHYPHGPRLSLPLARLDSANGSNTASALYVEEGLFAR